MSSINVSGGSERKKLDLKNKAIAKYKYKNNRFEIIVNPDLAFKLKTKQITEDEVPILEILEIDAVFSGADDSAIGVISALRESGYRIPEDVSVIGFDDLQLSAFLTPPLTTVKAPTELVGRIAAQQLIDLIAGKDVDPVTVLPTEVVIRRSCGCYACDNFKNSI